MNPRAFRGAYLHTVYQTHGLAFQCSQAETGDSLFARRATWAIITAANPRSEPSSPSENAARNASLRAVLREQGLDFEEALGSSPDGLWQEPGFLIWDAKLSEVLELGRRYRQNAVLYSDGKRLALAWCDDGTLEWFHARRLTVDSRADATDAAARSDPDPGPVT